VGRAGADHPVPSRTRRVQGIRKEPRISRVTTNDEATTANPASQSQTSHHKTHSEYQSDRASPTTRSPPHTATKPEAPAELNTRGRLTLPLDKTALHISRLERRAVASQLRDHALPFPAALALTVHHPRRAHSVNR